MVQATDLLPSSQPRVLVTILLLYSRAKTNVIASNGQKMQATAKPTPAADTKDVLRSWTAPARSGMLQQQGPTLGQADMSSINADQNNLAGSTSSVVGEGFPRSISGGSGRPQVGSVRQVASEVVPDVASKRVTQGTVRARNASTVSECISVMPVCIPPPMLSICQVHACDVAFPWPGVPGHPRYPSRRRRSAVGPQTGRGNPFLHHHANADPAAPASSHRPRASRQGFLLWQSDDGCGTGAYCVLRGQCIGHMRTFFGSLSPCFSLSPQH